MDQTCSSIFSPTNLPELSGVPIARMASFGILVTIGALSNLQKRFGKEIIFLNETWKIIRYHASSRAVRNDLDRRD
jgi:hypothetical protein